MNENKRHEIDKLLEKNIFNNLKINTSNNKFKISGLFDIFTETSLNNYFEIIDFNVTDEYEILKNRLIDINFFFIETCWDFKEISLALPKGSIQKISFENKTIPLLEKIKKISVENDFKIIIWNKEDPTNFDRFSYLINYTKYFFTSDVNMIEKYKLLYNVDVYCMGFFLDPYIHNPIFNNNIFDICFAGRVYTMHKERFDDSNTILKVCTYLDLVIFDRINDSTRKDSFLYYDEFKKHVYGKLNYYQILQIYKNFRYIINLNTVKNSDTMFARRVYEIIGLKKNVISNYSKGVKNNFKNIFIYENNDEELKKYLDETKINNNIINEYNKHLEWRNVNLNNSFAVNMNRLFNICDLKKIKLKTIFDSRIVIYYLKKNNNKPLNLIYTDNFKLIEINNVDEINENIKQVNFDFAIFISDNNYYDEYYIIDSLLLLEYSPYKIITKPNCLLEEYQIKKQNIVTLFNSIIKNNIKFSVDNYNLILDNEIEILFSDRFNYFNNLNNLNNFTVNSNYIYYDKKCVLEIKNNENCTLFYDDKKINLNSGVNKISLINESVKKFYFSNNSSVEFLSVKYQQD